MLPALTVEILLREAQAFAALESSYPEPSLFGVTDGKAVGTYLEHKFKAHLALKYAYTTGSSASGIDFPDLAIDIKTTSNKQPQSSCPFKSARQKIFGLGYSLLIFVYDKLDNADMRTATLNIVHTIFVAAERTADYQTTRGLRTLLDTDGTEDDIFAFIMDRYLPVDEVEAHNIAEELINGAPLTQGYLTISNALQWRLQYTRAITQAGLVDGIQRLR